MSVDMTTEELKRLAAEITPGPYICYADLPSVEPNWHIITTANKMRVIANVHIEPDSTMDAAMAELFTLSPDLLRELIDRMEADAPVTAREAELEAENERLTARAEKAEAERDEATGTIERLNSNNLTLCAELAGWKQAARQMEAERDQAVAAAFEAAAQEVGSWAGPSDIRMKTIRALTPTDAKASLEAYGREKVQEGMRRAANLFKDANHGKHIMDAILAEMETLK